MFFRSGSAPSASRRSAGLVSLIFFIPLLGLMLFLPVPASGATLVVGSGGFSTFSAAINAASPGDTLQVNPGNYYQWNITVDKQLYIVGPGGGAASIYGPSSSAYDLFIIQAHGVQISGLRLWNADTAIELGGYDDVVLDDLEFLGSDTRHIYGNGAERLTASNLQFNDADVGTALYLSQGHDLDLSRVSGAGSIYLSNSDSAVIDDVTLDAHMNLDGIGGTYSNLDLTCPGTGSCLVFDYGSDGNTLTNSVVRGGGSGIFFSSADDNTLTTVQVINAITGVTFYGTSEWNTLTGVTITGTDVGVRLDNPFQLLPGVTVDGVPVLQTVNQSGGSTSGLTFSDTGVTDRGSRLYLGVDNWTISNIQLQDDDIGLFGVDNVTLTGLNTYHGGIDIEQSRSIEISTSTFYDGEIGIHGVNSDRVEVHNSTFQQFSSNALYNYQGDDWDVHDNQVIDVVRGLRFYNQVGGRLENNSVTNATETALIATCPTCVIRNNTVDQVRFGIEGYGSTIEDNAVTNASEFGFRFSSSTSNLDLLERNTVDGEEILVYHDQSALSISGLRRDGHNPSNLGWVLIGDSNGVTIDDLQIHNNTRAAGIWIRDSNDITVQNGSFSGNDRGISVLTADIVQIEDNQFANGGGIYLNGIGEPFQSHVRSNQMVDVVGTGLYLYDSPVPVTDLAISNVSGTGLLLDQLSVVREIDLDNVTVDGQAIQIHRNLSHVTIEDFSYTATNATNRGSMILLDSDNVTLRRLHLHNNGAGSGLWVYGSPNTTVEDLHSSGAASGLHFGASPDSSAHNLSIDAIYTGFYLSGADRVLVENGSVNADLGASTYSSDDFEFRNLSLTSITGVRPYYSDRGLISAVDIYLEPNYGTGIYAEQSSDVTLEHSTISGGSTGVYLYDYNDNWLVYDNAFSGMSTYFSFYNSDDHTFYISPVTGPNVVGGATIAGNYWAHLLGTDQDENGLLDHQTYDVQGHGDVDLYPLYLADNLPPSAMIYSGPGDAAVMEAIQFTDLSSDLDGTIVSWWWEFGDGNNSSLQNPTHAYASAGTYLVDLTVIDDDGGIGMTTSVVEVTATELAPTSFFTMTGNLTAGEEIRFVEAATDADGVIQLWVWDFGDGTSSLDRDASHTYDLPGNYSVTLQVMDDDGLWGSSDQMIEILAGTPVQPVAEVAVLVSPIIVNESAVFADFSTPEDMIISWSYDFGDGSVMNFTDSRQARLVSHTYLFPGTYAVSLTVTSVDLLTDTDSLEIEVLASPTGTETDPGSEEEGKNEEGVVVDQISLYGALGGIGAIFLVLLLIFARMGKKRERIGVHPPGPEVDLMVDEDDLLD